MSRPSTTGKKRSGLLSKKGTEGGQNHTLLRPVGLLCVAYGGSHLRPSGKDAHPQGEPHPRSPFGNERHHPRRQALPHMGGLSDPPGSSGKGLSVKRGVKAA